MKRHLHTLVQCGLLASVAALTAAGAAPIANDANLWKIVGKEKDVKTSVTVDPDGPQKKACVKFSYTFNGTASQWVFVGAPAPSDLAAAKALRITYKVEGSKGYARPMVTLAERGGAQYVTEPRLPLQDEWLTLFVPITNFVLPAWSKDANGQLDLAEVQQIRIGIDGRPAGGGEGAILFADVEAVKEMPEGTTYPLPTWGISCDKAVEASTASVTDEASQAAITRLRFTFPGGKHMFAFATKPIRGQDVEGSQALRLTYKAQLPAGVKQVRVMLSEQDGSPYTIIVEPTGADEWKTVTIPLSSFKLGTWSKDENSQLDAGQVASLQIGADGTATGAGGTGTVWIKEYAFVK